MLAAVLWVDGWFAYTCTQVPQAMWAQFLDRKDHQIGGQEMLAVVLALGTFELQIREALVLLFVDNDGVRESLMRGSSRAAEVNRMAGALWLQLASWRTGLYTARVESKANIADGPTRDDLSLVARLSATFVQPVWPSWAWHFWTLPPVDCFT